MPKSKKSNKGRAAGSWRDLPALVDPRLVKALDHVLRQHILLAAVAGEVSPSDLSQELDQGLSQVSYHVKVLREDCDGMIMETRSEPRRGALEHYYRATPKTLLPAKRWRRLKKGLRAAAGAGLASDLFNDLADALKAGKLQGVNDHVVRTPLILDPIGQQNLRAIAERAGAEVEAEQRAAVKRIANGDGEGAGWTFALLAFEAAGEPSGARAAHATKASENGADGSVKGARTKKAHRDDPAAKKE